METYPEFSLQLKRKIDEEFREQISWATNYFETTKIELTKVCSCRQEASEYIKKKVINYKAKPTKQEAISNLSMLYYQPGNQADDNKIPITYITVDEAAIEQFEHRLKVKINLLTIDSNFNINEPLFLT